MNLGIGTPYKHLFKNFIYYAGGYILPGILSFILIPLIVRNFGSEVYAQYSIVFNCISVISLFCYNWVGQSYIRFYSLHFEHIDNLYNSFLNKSLLAGTICFIILFLFVGGIDTYYLAFTIPVFIISSYYNFYLLQYQAKQIANRIAFAEITRTAIALIIPLLTVLFFKRTDKLSMLFIALLSAYACSLGYLFISKKKNLQIAKPNSLQFNYKKQIRTYGLPIALFVSVSLALSVNDRYLIARLIDYKSAGDYAAVYDVMFKGISFACAPVLMTFFPHIVKQYNDGNKAGAYQSIKTALTIELVIFSAGILLLTFFGKFLLGVLLKQEITSGIINLAYVLYIGIFIWQAAMLIHKPLELNKQTYHLAIGVVLAFILNFGFNFFLISHYKNIMVAAYTTLGASIFYLLYVAFFSLRNK